MKRLLLFSLLSLAFSQSLFESAENTSALNYDLSGNIKSFISLQHTNDSLIFNNMNAEASLKIKVKKDPLAYAFADMHFIHRNNIHENESKIKLREAYIDITPGIFNFRLGKQILPWGRTDMYKPTDNITPQDLRYLYTDPNDMRLGTFLINSSINPASFLKIQGIVIPYYNPNLLPISLFEFPENVTYTPMELPQSYVKQSGVALKLDLRTSRYDISFSYLNAYALQAAFASNFTFVTPTEVSYTFFQEPWRQQVIGFDAAFNLNSWAYRFEAAYMHPNKNSSDHYTPHPQAQFSLGLDKTSGPLNILCEYNLNIVPNYSKLSIPSNPLLLLEYQLNTYNQLFYRQTDYYNHQIFVFLSVNLFQETLSLELPMAYNLSTRDYLLSMQMSYHLVDALDINLGIQKYGGQNNSLYELLKPLYNGYYCELKLSF